MRTCILAVILLALTAVPAQAVELLRGPYLQQVTPTSAIVVFETDESCQGEVRYGTDAALEGSASGLAAQTQHEITLEELLPDTTYQYTVASAGVPLSYGHTLTTAPPEGEPFRFVVFGDTRSDHDAHREVMAAIALEDFAALLNTGDLVSRGDDLTDWDTFFEIEGPVIDEVPLYPVVGNHDESGGAAVEYEGAFALPDVELYYSFDLGNAHFVILDGYVNMVLACVYDETLIDICFDEDQLAWLEADLADTVSNPAIEHVFVLAHVGPYSSKSGRTGSAHMRYLLPMFEQYGVRAILSGHDHYYERGFSGNELAYIITGGGGAPLYTIGEPTDDPHTVEYNDALNHYVMVEVDHETIRFSARDTDGVTFDELLLTVDPSDNPGDDDTTDDPSADDPGSGVPLSESQPGCECGTAHRGDGIGAALIPTLLLTAVALRRRRG